MAGGTYSASYSDAAQSSQTVTGNTFGGINLGNQANVRNMPDWLANRISTKPQNDSIALSDPLNMVLIASVFLVVGTLIIKKVA